MLTGQGTPFRQVCRNAGCRPGLKSVYKRCCEGFQQAQQDGGAQGRSVWHYGVWKGAYKELSICFWTCAFVESQFMGKAGKLALAELRSMEKVDKRFVTLSEVQMGAMRNLLERYEKGIPRSLKMERTQLPCVVFTDGACEPGSGGQVICTVGGVIFDPNEGGVIEAFGSHVSDSVVDSWKSASKVHPVAQTEMYAECVARHLWHSRLDGRKCLFFIDNQGDLDALIKGYSKEETMKALLVVLEQLDSNDPCLPWYCRVPSPCNVADLPSRGKWKELFALFPECREVSASCPFSSRKLQRIEQS